MSEVWFYHLLRQGPRNGLEGVLPVLLEKSLERGWRACIEGPDLERLEALDSALWTFREESFLPHAMEGTSYDEDQPVLLTQTSANTNDAKIRFLIDGAEIDDPSPYDRVIYIFDGRNDEAVATARTYWKRLKDQEITATYWQQTDAGGWEKKA